MQTMQKGYRGLSLLMELNWDRALYVTTVTGALGAGAWMSTILS